MKSIFKLFPVLLLSLLVFSCTLESASKTPATVISTVVTPSIVSIDFDHGLPSPHPRTPFDLTSDGVTVHFSSASDPAAFSVQNSSSTFFKLSQLSGNYLYPNTIFRDNLKIEFNQAITSITLIFATTDSHSVGEVENPSTLKLTAFQGSAGSNIIGSTTGKGVFSSDPYPQGVLTFDSGSQRFQSVLIEFLPPNRTATGFIIDDIKITIAK